MASNDKYINWEAAVALGKTKGNDDTERRVVNEPVHLTQEFRDFDFLSPWEGMQHEIDAASQKSNADKASE